MLLMRDTMAVENRSNRFSQSSVSPITNPLLRVDILQRIVQNESSFILLSHLMENSIA